MIKTRKVVKRKVWTTYDWDCPQGSGYCKEHYDRQYLVKEWRLWGILIWRRVLDSEDVPVYASVGIAVLGSTEWRSKFSEYI